MANRFRKRRYYRKRRGGKGSSIWSMAKKAYGVASKVASIINSEAKAFDTDAAPTPDSATGYIQAINNPAQGSAWNQRDGDSLKMKSIVTRFLYYRSAASTQSGTTIRLIIFVWKQPTSTPALTDILETATIDSPKNFDKRFMSKVLHDEIIELNSGSGNTKHKDVVIDFQRRHKKYAHVQFATGTTNMNNNGVYILLLSNEATNTPTVNFYARTHFFDN